MTVKHTDGRRSLGADKTHLESIHPDVRFPVTTPSPIDVTLRNLDPDEIQTVIDIHEVAGYGDSSVYHTVSKFGRNLAIANGATAEIWTPGGTRTWLTAADALIATSTSGADTAAGAGAQQITVDGLDDNWEEATEVITMNGLGDSTPTTTQFIRVNRVFVSRMGTYHDNNNGIITVETDVAGTEMAEILAAVGQTEQTHFSVAHNRACLLLGHYISTDSSKVINAAIYQAANVNDVSTPFGGAVRKIWGVTGLQGHTSHHYNAHPLLSGASDIWWEATSFANGTEVEAGFDLMCKFT
jgi:hypothetical protein